jgi:3-oxoadipate enol-lactonase
MKMSSVSDRTIAPVNYFVVFYSCHGRALMPIASLNAARLFYEERGSGPPILFIHGTGADSDIWSGSVALGADYRCIAYDRRGYGRSPLPAGESISLEANDAAALLKLLGAVPAMIVGHSLGGVIALDLAVEHPQLVAGLLLVEPPLRARLQRRPDLSAVRAMIAVHVLRLVGSRRASAERFLRWAYGSDPAEGGYRNIPGVARAAGESYDTIIHELGLGTGEHLTPERLGSIAVPVNFLLGELTAAGMRRLVIDAVGMIPGAVLHMVPDASHGLHVTRPDMFIDAVRSMSGWSGER